MCFFFFFQAEDGIRDLTVTGVQTCALPILPGAGEGSLADCLQRAMEQRRSRLLALAAGWDDKAQRLQLWLDGQLRSEEHTSELQSQSNLVCRLLLEKKKAQDVEGITHVSVDLSVR